jgi:hypothetical protein
MCANANPPGATKDSGSILVALASAKCTQTRRNDAVTPEMENSEKVAESVEKQSTSVDRRISVAPMMDWTDESHPICLIKDLRSAESRVNLFVPAKNAEVVGFELD